MKLGLQLLLFLLLGGSFLTSCQSATTAPNGTAKKEDGGKASENKRPKNNDITPRGLDFANAPEVVAFGSCAHQDKPQPIWDIIYKNNPELFIFMGDNVYASDPTTKPIGTQYKKLNIIPEFRHFRENVPFLATWDDHDSGLNDSGADNPEKEEARREFLNQWTYVRDSLSVGQKGLYHAKILGGVGKKSPTFQVIMLDTRWFRSPLKKVENSTDPLRKFEPTTDKKTTILGEEQWAWLEKQLRKPADVRVVVSSIQFVAEEHGFEKWGNFPHEKERFFNLLRKVGPKNLFIISGDRHIGTMAKQEVKGWGTLYDITASSINRPKDLNETDASYLGKPINSENFGLIMLNWSRKKIEVQLRDASNKIVNSVEMKIK
ncbi:MAG: alkaline phosphatase family protein [Bdellovibrionaceae bacterium]|nr:alkaline phosphatase family protein [Pseudobdellovibrionaceae bacterium]